MKAEKQLKDRKRAEYRIAVDRLRELERKYRDAQGSLSEMGRIARWASDQWAGEAALLAPSTK